MKKIVPKWSGVVENGKLKIEMRDRFSEYLLSLEGKKVDMVVKQSFRRRSLKANRYYRGVVLWLISDATGHSPDELHEIFKLKFNPKEIKVGKKSYIIGDTTTTHSTAEFGEFVEKVIRFGTTELNIFFPSPDDVAENL